jgi:glycosyltransferase involved in cell wall biosynthesis
VIKGELGIPEDVLVVGHVGSFRPPKNHDWMVDIAAEMVKRTSKILFLFIGDGPLRPAITEKVKKLGLSDKTLFLGQRQDVPRLLLGSMDVFLFPSLYEGMPLSMVEAQAAGRQCIVSDTIAEEATVIKPLVHKVSLSESASYWVEEILKAADRRPSISQAEALGIIKNSDFNVYVGIGKIEEWYRALALQIQ